MADMLATYALIVFSVNVVVAGLIFTVALWFKLSRWLYQYMSL